MMNNFKGILSGVLFILIASLTMQLLFILIRVGYNSLAINLPLLKDVSWIFKYLLVIPFFILIMFLGGYITTIVAKSSSIINSFIVGLVVTAGMMWSALANTSLTTTGIIINFLIVIAIVLGGFSASKKTK